MKSYGLQQPNVTLMFTLADKKIKVLHYVTLLLSIGHH